MGATTFCIRRKGATAQEAFDRATSEARHENGHNGYTGTIADKHDFVIIPVLYGTSIEQARQIAQELLDNEDRRIRDKRGPAGAINLGDGTYLFFGWAPE